MIVKAGWAYIVLGGRGADRGDGAAGRRSVLPAGAAARRRSIPTSVSIRKATIPNLPVRIVDIDEQSLAGVGQWPWARTTIAGDARAVVRRRGDHRGVRRSVHRARSDLAGAGRQAPDAGGGRRCSAPVLADRPGHDGESWRQAIASGPTVLATVLTDGRETGQAPTKAGFAVAGDDPRPFIPAFAGNVNQSAGAGGGGLRHRIDQLDPGSRSGRAAPAAGLPRGRRTGADPRHGDACASPRARAPTFSRRPTPAARPHSARRPGSTTSRSATSRFRPTPTGRCSSSSALPTRPASFRPGRWFRATFDPNDVAGRIVLVGSSAAGLNDLQATPLDAALPGVEVQAQAIEHLMSGRSLTRPDHALALETALRPCRRHAPRHRPAAHLRRRVGAARRSPPSSSCSSAAGCPIAMPACCSIRPIRRWRSSRWSDRRRSTSIGSVEQQRGEVRRAFGHYVSPAVVDELIANPGPSRTRRRGARTDAPVLRRAQLHLDFRADDGARTDPVHQQPAQPAQRDHPQASRDDRQIHGRRHHGVLECAARRSRRTPATPRSPRWRWPRR